VAGQPLADRTDAAPKPYKRRGHRFETCLAREPAHAAGRPSVGLTVARFCPGSAIQGFDGLAGDCRDEIEVLVNGENGQGGLFSGCCDQQVGN
jgi:hypothetical protein